MSYSAGGQQAIIQNCPVACGIACTFVFPDERIALANRSCRDRPDYVDENGLTCSRWGNSRRCFANGSSSVLTNCPKTCNSCPCEDNGSFADRKNRTCERILALNVNCRELRLRERLSSDEYQQLLTNCPFSCRLCYKGGSTGLPTSGKFSNTTTTMAPPITDLGQITVKEEIPLGLYVILVVAMLLLLLFGGGMCLIIRRRRRHQALAAASDSGQAEEQQEMRERLAKIRAKLNNPKTQEDEIAVAAAAEEGVLGENGAPCKGSGNTPRSL
eukprot:TRINITY_DN4992_c0_g4_i1.p1 TRINITY_DN4992_c0_g4~~TRINITY_DN4992_c0_g4_i1.p1  ORF type:complete len:301 (+),score=40.99 TRINITY_DN4992_c0_g4_i1:88-903(+)